MLWSTLYSLLKRMVYTVGKVDWFSLALVSGQGALPSYYSFHILERTVALLNLVASHKSLASFFPTLIWLFFNRSPTNILRSAALFIIGWLTYIHPPDHCTGHGWNRCKHVFSCIYFCLTIKWVTHYIHCINDHRRILPL